MGRAVHLRDLPSDTMAVVRQVIATAPPSRPVLRAVLRVAGELARQRAASGTDPFVMTPRCHQLCVALAREAVGAGLGLRELQRGTRRILVLLNSRTWADADPDEADRAGHRTAWTYAAVQAVDHELRNAVVAELAAGGAGRRARAVLVNELVAGRGEPALATAAGVTLHRAYWVAVTADPVPHDDRLLVGCLGDRLVMLVEGADLEGDWSAFAALLPRVAGVAHAASVSAIPAAVREAEIVFDAAAGARLAGPVRARDVLVERLLLATPALAAEAAEVVGPLENRPDLVATLLALYASNLDRQASARRLGIHRGTLAHRLRTVHRLVGVDPTSCAGICLLSAALGAARMKGALPSLESL